MTKDQHADAAPAHEDAVGHDATDDHAADQGHDDHEHDAEPLGPIDVAAWGAGALGLLAGLAVAIAFYVSTAPVAG